MAATKQIKPILGSEKLCSMCREWKSLEQYSKNRTKSDGRDTRCKSCKSSTEKARRREGKGAKRDYSPEAVERRRAQAREYARMRQRTSRTYLLRHLLRLHGLDDDLQLLPTVTLTDGQWHAMQQWFEWKCVCCDEEVRLTMDHVIPVSLGGVNHITNIQPLCLKCNSTKGNRIRDYRNPERLATFLAQLLNC